MKLATSVKGLTVLLLLSITLGAVGKGTPDNIPLKGRSLFSFAPDYFLVQTERYIFKIKRANLPPNSQFLLENASTQGNVIQVNVPRRSVEFLWPTRPYNNLEDTAQKYHAMTTRLGSQARLHDGRLILNGQSKLSFSGEYYLVEVDDAIYQLKKAALLPGQSTRLEQIGPGGRVDIVVPREALQSAWSLKTEPGPQLQRQLNDEIAISEKVIKIRGTVLYSFNDPLVLVQSRGYIFQIRKNRIATKTPQLLDIPGSKIRLSAPIEAIEFSWFTEPDDLKLKRLPSSLL